MSQQTTHNVLIVLYICKKTYFIGLLCVSSQSSRDRLQIIAVRGFQRGTKLKVSKFEMVYRFVCKLYVCSISILFVIIARVYQTSILALWSLNRRLYEIPIPELTASRDVRELATCKPHSQGEGRPAHKRNPNLIGQGTAVLFLSPPPTTSERKFRIWCMK